MGRRKNQRNIDKNTKTFRTLGAYYNKWKTKVINQNATFLPQINKENIGEQRNVKNLVVPILRL